jgi:hypothetical protein
VTSFDRYLTTVHAETAVHADTVSTFTLRLSTNDKEIAARITAAAASHGHATMRLPGRASRNRCRTASSRRANLSGDAPSAERGRTRFHQDGPRVARLSAAAADAQVPAVAGRGISTHDLHRTTRLRRRAAHKAKRATCLVAGARRQSDCPTTGCCAADELHITTNTCSTGRQRYNAARPITRIASSDVNLTTVTRRRWATLNEESTRGPGRCVARAGRDRTTAMGSCISRAHVHHTVSDGIASDTRQRDR